MKTEHDMETGPRSRRDGGPDGPHGHGAHGHGHGPHGHGPHGHGQEHGLRRGRRPFDYGALRLIVLAMVAERPSHGYELMKAIEERTGGGYSPSPGVIYPTLSWLEDMGFALAEADGGRRSYRITPEGEAFLAGNREALAALTARLGGAGGRRHGAPDAVLEAMGGLKQALRARFRSGPVDAATIARIAAALQAATRDIMETTPMNETTEMVRSVAHVPTPKAAGYLAQLCKHFAHRIPASYEGNDGEISFPAGTCRLHAEGEVLTLTAEAADAGGLATVQDVVARHLLRFAFREDLAIDWTAA